MNTEFEINDTFRLMDNSELIYTLSNSEKMASLSRKDEYTGFNDLPLCEILERLTPARQKVAFAAIELYKRTREKKSSKRFIKCSKDIIQIMSPILSDLETEELWVIYLNRAVQVIRKVRLATGGLGEVVADVQIMMKYAVKWNANSFILVHNHPSGNVRPSSSDDAVTKRAQKAGEFMGVKLLDHLIIDNNGDEYFSYADEGRL